MTSMTNFDHTKIEARRREIAAEIIRLQKEDEELEIGLKVVQRFSASNGIGVLHASGKSKLGPVRPNGIPTNFEMVDLILLGAEKEGRDGLTVKEIVEEISVRYWPGVEGQQIMPSIYQFAKDNRFRKTPSGKLKRNRNNKDGSES
jgi:hypothetical protein